MGWWRRMLGRAEKRSISYQDYWGTGADIAGVRSNNIDTALQLVPVFAATRLLSDTIASLPLQVYRRTGDVRTQIDVPALFGDPTMFGTSYQWVQRAVTSVVLRGNAVGYVTAFTADDRPRQVEWLHPDEVHVDDNQAIRRPMWRWRGHTMDPSRVVHIPGYVLPGLVKGLSPIAHYALTVETGLLSQRFGRDWFRNSSTPGGVVESDQKIDGDTADIVKKRFIRSAANREPVVMGLGLKYKPITVAPEESQFLATIRATTNQVAAIYGIPPERIGGESSSSRTYANREQDALDFVTYSLGPYLANFELAFSRLLPRGQYVKFNVDALLRADLKTRYDAHHLALTDGWKSKDEVRKVEELPPIPSGKGAGFAPMLGPKTQEQDTEREEAARLHVLANGGSS